MDTLSGAVELLAGAISYMLAVCAPIGAADFSPPSFGNEDAGSTFIRATSSLLTRIAVTL